MKKTHAFGHIVAAAAKKEADAKKQAAFDKTLAAHDREVAAILNVPQLDNKSAASYYLSILTEGKF